MNSELSKILRQKREYASYFHFGRDKTGTEIGVVGDWLQARYETPSSRFVSMRHLPNPCDPPDVVLTDLQGHRYGVEVTEFVDGAFVRAHAKGETNDLRLYDDEEFYRLVTERIRRKADVPFKDASYYSRILILYSDELALEPAMLSNIPPVSQGYFDEIWFMIPPAACSGHIGSSNPPCRIYAVSRPNKPTPVNAPTASRFQVERPYRRVPE
ncbi:MAG: hypothetical protein JNN07_03745 [Verrucomicrobiales bacterium]|nr:hypothetical protein [Verrucomicrobiales bacterium]